MQNVNTTHPKTISMKNTTGSRMKLSRKIIISGIIGVANLTGLSALYFSCGTSSAELSVQQQSAIDAAYAAGQKAVNKRAEELRQWYLCGKQGTQAAAEELTGWGSKWKVATGSDDEVRSHVEAVINKHVFSGKDSADKELEIFGLLLQDLDDIENELAVNACCFSLASTGNKLDTSKCGLINGNNCPDDLKKALHAELVSLVGSTVTEFLVVRLATSVGILSVGAGSATVTWGVGLGVGVLVDFIVSAWMDPTDDIQADLNVQVEQTADIQAEQFRKVMSTLLEKRKAYWEQEISGVESAQ